MILFQRDLLSVRCSSGEKEGEEDIAEINGGRMQRLRVDANRHGYGGKFHLRGAWASEMKFAGTWSRPSPCWKMKTFRESDKL